MTAENRCEMAKKDITTVQIGKDTRKLIEKLGKLYAQEFKLPSVSAPATIHRAVVDALAARGKGDA